ICAFSATTTTFACTRSGGAPRSSRNCQSEEMMRIVRPGDDVHIAAVIPAFNVAGHIGGVLTEMPDQIRTIIVVDDGSSDNTTAEVEQCASIDRRIQLIRHDRNRGVGAAMVTGFTK